MPIIKAASNASLKAVDMMHRGMIIRAFFIQVSRISTTIRASEEADNGLKCQGIRFLTGAAR